MDADRAVWILLALVLAPWSVLGLVAILRGYDVHVVFRRRRRPPPEE